MNAPPWPANPSIGQTFQNWVWGGSQWIATPTTGLRVLTRTFTASEPYMPSPGLVSLTVECIGGGGGGGSAGPGQTDASILTGGGGASGGYARKTVAAALVRGGVTVTVGGGGGGGQSGYPVGAGGATSFGALCVANGGLGGQGCDGINTGGFGGRSAPAGIGDLAPPGLIGGDGYFNFLSTPFAGSAWGGAGSALWGGNTRVEANRGNGSPGGNAADNTGAGGSGAVVNQWQYGGVQDGGNGGSGLCIVTEYCWGDRDDVNAWSPPLNVNLNWPRPPFPPGGPWPPGLPPPGPWPRSEDDC